MSIDFAAIDFETANSFRGSPCAVGLVVVRNGKVTDEHYRLMRPPGATGPEDFDDYNTDLHGIDWEKVRDQPKFLAVWRSLAPIIGELPLVAHNAGFDIGVLRDALDESDAPWPTLSYTCTLVTSRRVLNLPSYSLPFVATELKVALGQHHQALDDARTAASILLRLCERTATDTVDSLLRSIRVGWGELSEGNWRGSTVARGPRGPRTRTELPEPRSGASPEHFLYGKHVVLTGALPGGVTRTVAHERIAYFGGIPQDRVTKETSLLVVGAIAPHSLAPGAKMTKKMDDAFTLQAKGQCLEIMTGFDFLPVLE